MQTSSNIPKSPRQIRPNPDTDRRKFKAICRVRPLQESEPSKGSPISMLDITISADAPSVTIFNSKTSNSKEYTFHRVYSDTTRQEDFTRAMTD